MNYLHLEEAHANSLKERLDVKKEEYPAHLNWNLGLSESVGDSAKLFFSKEDTIAKKVNNNKYI